MTKARGFTLIELMVTLIVVAILAAIAIPTYRQSVIKGNRRAAQSVMMELVSREQQYFIANRAYATDEELGYLLPPEVSTNYSYNIVPDNAASPPTFTVDFTAINGQVGDGNLSINSVGDKTPLEKW